MSRRRRSQYDPLQAINAPTWLVVRDPFNAVLSSTRLEPLADLRSLIIAEQLRRQREGWQLEETDLNCSTFFCSKDGQRVSVGISRNDPHLPGPMDRPPRESAWSSNVVQLKRRTPS